MTPDAWDDQPAGGGPTGPLDDRHEVRQAVVDAVRSRPDLVADPERLDGYLRDVCPLQPAEVAVVVVAARTGVADELAQSSEGHPGEATAARVAKRLNAESGIDHGLARWAVDTWALALGPPALLPPTHSKNPGPPAPVVRPTEPAGPAPVRPPATMRPTIAPPPEPGTAESPAPAGTGEDAAVLRAMAVRPSPPAPAPVPPQATKARPAAAAPPSPLPIDDQSLRTVQRPRGPATAPAEAPPDRTGRRRNLAIGAGGVAACALAIALVAGLSGGGSGTASPTTLTSAGSVTTAAPATTATSSTLAPTTKVTAAPRAFPAKEAAMAPGVYATTTFEPRLTVTVGDGWKFYAQSPLHVELHRADSDTEFLNFLRSPRPLRRDRVFTDYEEAKKTTATEPPPSDLITWLRADSRFRVSAATPATVGGVQGVQVDVTVPAGTTMTLCGRGCVPLFQLNDLVFALAPGSVNRFYVVATRGHQFVIVAEAHADRSGPFVEQANRVVDTIAFND